MENQFGENIEITDKSKSSENKKNETNVFFVVGELNKRLRHFSDSKNRIFKNTNLRYLFIYRDE